MSTPRSSELVKVFRTAGTTPRILLKKGSSDMNTLATTWSGVPTASCGPGDAEPGRTLHEHVDAAGFRLAQAVPTDAVREWIAAGRPAGEAR
ncbi:hypothetical protein [Streptomyces sp. URMC 129]|uniref:hypothetical protein n=1 Tax=Streptomyces sp. URMC 129 TaxID=3423407 RepID=UPI003F1BABA3